MVFTGKTNNELLLKSYRIAYSALHGRNTNLLYNLTNINKTLVDVGAHVRLKALLILFLFVFKTTVLPIYRRFVGTN